MGTAELEAVLISVEEVAEAAVVGFPHQIKGQGVYAYVVQQPGQVVDLEQLNAACRTQIGAHAKLDKVQVVPGLPKTRSGKVMRRILRKIAEGHGDQLGDVSTLADPSIVEAIRAGAHE
jgi:acetyl-CoA synthetase